MILWVRPLAGLHAHFLTVRLARVSACMPRLGRQSPLVCRISQRLPDVGGLCRSWEWRSLRRLGSPVGARIHAATCGWPAAWLQVGHAALPPQRDLAGRNTRDMLEVRRQASKAMAPHGFRPDARKM